MKSYNIVKNQFCCLLVKDCSGYLLTGYKTIVIKVA
jgi:hypothetical protein